MVGTSGFLETTKNSLKVDIKEVPFIVRTVLGQLGWGNFFFDTGLATADKRKQLKRAGMTRALEHRVQVKWRKSQVEGDSGVYVRVQIDDGDGNVRVEELKDACVEVMKGLFGRVEELVAHEQKEKRTTYGSAKWAEQEDLVKAGYVTQEEDGLRLILGLTDTGEPVSISPEDTIRHAVVGGPTGSGKTSKIIIPQMIKRWKASAIVTEATAGDEPPDVYQKTAGFRKAMGHKIYKFDPGALDSHRINPVDQVNSVDEAQTLANLIVENTNKRDGGGGGEQIWDNSERHLLIALLLHAAGKRASLAEVRGWLTSGQEGMKTELLSSVVEKAKSEYMAFYNVSTEQFRNGVISGLMMRLNLWVNPRIAALTAATDVDIEGMRKELFTFYLSVPAQKGHLKPLSALIFNYVLSQTEKDFEKPLFLCLDEFTNFGRIADFVNKTTIIRHRKIGAILGFQDYMQLEKTYGRDDAKILWGQLGTKILFKPNDLDTAKRTSEMLGTETYFERTMSSSGQIHEKEFGRSLMNPGEVLAMGDERALVFTPKTSPIKLKTYSWKDFADEMAIQPPKRDKIAVDEGLFKACEQARRTPEWQTTWAQAASPELNYIHETISDTAEGSSKPIDIFTTEDQPVSKEEVESPVETQESAEPELVTSEQELESTAEEDPYGSGAVI